MLPAAKKRPALNRLLNSPCVRLRNGSLDSDAFLHIWQIETYITVGGSKITARY
jgi:hypothetical protein